MQILSDALRQVGELGWNAFQAVNRRIAESESVAPNWAPGPLLKSHQRTHPPLCWPRETDSLCPRCVVATREAIIRGERDLSELVSGRRGEIRARIEEEGGKLVIKKSCPEHGSFDDLLSIDPEFSRVIEGRYPGRDFRTYRGGVAPDRGEHAHGGHHQGLVRPEGAPPDLRGRPPHAAAEVAEAAAPGGAGGSEGGRLRLRLRLPLATNRRVAVPGGAAAAAPPRPFAAPQGEDRPCGCSWCTRRRGRASASPGSSPASRSASSAWGAPSAPEGTTRA